DLVDAGAEGLADGLGVTGSAQVLAPFLEPFVQLPSGGPIGPEHAQGAADLADGDPGLVYAVGSVRAQGVLVTAQGVRLLAEINGDYVDHATRYTPPG